MRSAVAAAATCALLLGAAVATNTEAPTTDVYNYDYLCVVLRGRTTNAGAPAQSQLANNPAQRYLHVHVVQRARD